VLAKDFSSVVFSCTTSADRRRDGGEGSLDAGRPPAEQADERRERDGSERLLERKSRWSS
jgi:hypothetical protein